MEVKQGASITSWIFVLIHLQRKPSVGLSKNYDSSDIYEMGQILETSESKISSWRVQRFSCVHFKQL